MKKRYGKVFAYFLCNFSLMAVSCLILGIFYMVSNEIGVGIYCLIYGIIGAFITFLMTKRLNSRTPKEERVATWFRAWKLGVKIALNITLKIIGFIFHCSIGFDTSIPEEDTVATSRGEWYEKRKYVYDENGNQYEVGRSGGYIQDKSGNWIKVERDDVGEPYIGSGSEKTWLK
ncbi:MAG: hypothetical protein IKK47_02915 [Ruminococcus sp.]|nr:hypothetical protein [Ruminococcus sp.]